MVLLNPAFKPRLYQEAILSSAVRKNTLVVLPTGLGKTAIAALLAAQRLDHHLGKVLFLAPTKPLAQQHLTTFKGFFDLPDESFALFTGSTPPAKRVALWKDAVFVFSTPQGMENDLIGRKISLEDVILLVVDEAHRAVGDYSYTFIAKQYHDHARHERLLALTASPGSDETTIKEVCANLFIEAIEARSAQDADVRPYVQDLDIAFVEVLLGDDLKKTASYLQRCYDSKIAEAQTLGLLDDVNGSKTALLGAQAALHGRIAQGDKSLEVLKTISLLAEAMKVQHALELAESQTVAALDAYLKNLQKLALTSSTKAVQNLVRDTNFREACLIVDRLVAEGKEHPKIQALLDIITRSQIAAPGSKAIVFTQFRDTAVAIKRHLAPVASCEIFVGQAKKGDTGLSQKKQKEMLDRFRNDRFTTLIATSVAEEGLDIPAVDTVIFYEPIPSAIRTVQRRGRTGRHDAGKVYMLVAKGTRDEAYRWSAHHKEKRMYRNLASMKKTFIPSSSAPLPSASVVPQTTITEFSEEKKASVIPLRMTVDYREKGSPVMKALLAAGVELDLAQLSVGDYRIDDGIVVEYKTVKDFVDSIIDGRLLTQLRGLRGSFTPVIIVEGPDDIYGQRLITPAAVRGMIAMITISYHIPLLRTSSSIDTAGMLIALARRSQRSEQKNTFQPHAGKPVSLREQQEYIVSSLPGIGGKLAGPLLEHFGSVRNVMVATEKELREVEKVAEKKAKAIKDVLDAEYS